MVGMRVERVADLALAGPVRELPHRVLGRKTACITGDGLHARRAAPFAATRVRLLAQRTLILAFSLKSTCPSSSNCSCLRRRKRTIDMDSYRVEKKAAAPC